MTVRHETEAKPPRVETDGCSELTCIYHGAENRRKRDEQSK